MKMKKNISYVSHVNNIVTTHMLILQCTFCIAVYHVKFKTYNGLRTSENDSLPKIVIGNVS